MSGRATIDSECPYCASLYPGHRCTSCGAPKTRGAKTREPLLNRFGQTVGVAVGRAMAAVRAGNVVAVEWAVTPSTFPTSRVIFRDECPLPPSSPVRR